MKCSCQLKHKKSALVFVFEVTVYVVIALDDRQNKPTKKVGLSLRLSLWQCDDRIGLVLNHHFHRFVFAGVLEHIVGFFDLIKFKMMRGKLLHGQLTAFAGF